ncbi:hypothetical protein BV25DRAFT_1783022, partial [Artomyces pyxidatus]
KRPVEVQDWIKRHRDYNKPSVVKSSSKFAGSWRAWWTSNQPAWRTSASDVTWPLGRVGGVGALWLELMKGGPNGLVLFLITIVWWT